MTSGWPDPISTPAEARRVLALFEGDAPGAFATPVTDNNKPQGLSSCTKDDPGACMKCLLLQMVSSRTLAPSHASGPFAGGVVIVP